MSHPRAQESEVVAVVSLSPGETVTHLLLAVAVERTGGASVTPRITPSGTRIALPPRFLGGAGELVVTIVDDQTRVRLEGTPPPWPWSRGWHARTLRHLLGRRCSRIEVALPSE